MLPNLLSIPFRSCLRLLSLLPIAGLAQSNYATPYAFTTLAGTASIGSADGSGPASRFFAPADVAVDATGNIYVADHANHTIRKITPAGVTSTLAGAAGQAGSTDGAAPEARFREPRGLALDSSGNLFVADSGNHTVRKITPAGVVSTVAGAPGQPGHGDGPGTAARFDVPYDLAFDAAGNLFVSDRGNHVIRKIAVDGSVATFAGSATEAGAVDGPVDAARFAAPQHLTISAAGDLYVSDFYNDDVRKITPGGLVSTLLPGIVVYVGSSRLTGNHPAGVAVAQGKIYVAMNAMIAEITSGSPVAWAGASSLTGSNDGPGDAARFLFPEGLAADAQGNLLVADAGNNTVRKITAAGMTSTLGGYPPDLAQGKVDGPALLARFGPTLSLATGPQGEVYVADTVNSTVRKITPAGEVTTFAGVGREPGSLDGLGAAARFNGPWGVAADTAGNVYVTDFSANTVRKITPAGLVTTLAGLAGATGASVDGTGNAARFDQPAGIAVDAAGTLYVTEPWQNTVRKVTAGGVVTTFAGHAGTGGSSDGIGGAARFDHPGAIVFAPNGNLYVAEGYAIRRIAPDATVTTLAGVSGIPGTEDGTGNAARFDGLRGLAVDAGGNLYALDGVSRLIRKITPDGTVSTLAGSPYVRGHCDGLGREVHFDSVNGLALDATGRLYVADHTRLRRGIRATGPVITTQPQSLTVAAGGSVQFSVTAGAVPDPTYQWFFNGNPFSGATGSTLSFGNARSTDAGDYTVVVTNALGSVTSAKATLTVTAAPPPPAPAGGGGGGAPSIWFALALLALVSGRCRQMVDSR